MTAWDSSKVSDTPDERAEVGDAFHAVSPFGLVPKKTTGTFCPRGFTYLAKSGVACNLLLPPYQRGHEARNS